GAEELCLAFEPCGAFRLLGGCGASEQDRLDRTGTPIEVLISPLPDRTHVTGSNRRDESIPATHQLPRMQRDVLLGQIRIGRGELRRAHAVSARRAELRTRENPCTTRRTPRIHHGTDSPTPGRVRYVS